MKTATYVAGLLGLLVLTAMVVHQGLGEVWGILSSAGWGLLWLVPFHALPLLLDAQGWRVLLAPSDPEGRADLPFLLWVATVREAVNRLLPTASVGGEIVGIRLAKLRVPSGAAVTATVVMEVLLTLITQYLLTGLGLVLLLRVTGAGGAAWTIVAAVALSLPLPIVFGALLRYGKIFARMEKVVEHMLGDGHKLAVLLDGANLDAAIGRLYSQHGRLLLALFWQFAGYLLGTFETWLALKLLGHPVGLATAIAIEAATQAVRHVVFFVPGGLGVQEAGLVLFGHLVGIGNDVALSLSLAKRVREVLFGVPALLSWQWFEGRMLHRRLRAF